MASRPDTFPLAAVEAAVGSAPTKWTRVATRGYARANAHWRAALADGRLAFVKHALTPDAAAWLPAERVIYEAVRGRFLPAFLGAYDDGELALVALEDLSDAEWPPPWSGPRIDAVLGSALPTLLQASAEAPLDGTDLLHLDVRSDNLCLREGRALLFDWNCACVGNGDFDLAFWLPSLALEGGPPPWEVLPGGGRLAAVAGFFAARAGLPPPATAPTVREFQRAQAGVAMAWAARELGFEPPAAAPAD